MLSVGCHYYWTWKVRLSEHMLDFYIAPFGKFFESLCVYVVKFECVLPTVWTRQSVLEIN